MCQVQVEVIQKRQKEKKAMMNAVKKYQKGEGFFVFWNMTFIIYTAHTKVKHL